MIRASAIAAFLDSPLVGPDLPIDRPRPLAEPIPHSLLFVRKFVPEQLAAVNEAQEVLVVAPPEYAGQLRPSHIIVAQPRLAVARILKEFFVAAEKPTIAPTAVIDPSARIAAGVSIGHYSVIGASVEIGADTVIRNHVVVSAETVIGERCLIKSHAVIGEEGFGMEFDEADMPLRIPHIGRVVIGDEVEVGAFCTIARATLTETVVGDFVKLDDHVHVSHNVRIGDGVLVAVGAVISGSVKIGRRAWIGPNAAINSRLSLAENSLTGIGAVVMWSAEPGQHLVGNPAQVTWMDTKPYRS